jgi:polyphosphate kinase 2 (PPK2 family)
VFQVMDTAGKDGATRHLMSDVKPQGCQVFSFQHPSARELQHDFLWATTRDLPERGRIGIFTRSYYEKVLIVRVHSGLLHSECLPEQAYDNRCGTAATARLSTWKGRCAARRTGRWPA